MATSPIQYDKAGVMHIQWEPDPWYKERAKELFDTTGFRQVVRYRDRDTHEPVCYAWQNVWVKYPKSHDARTGKPFTLLPFEDYISTKLSSKWDDAEKQLQSSISSIHIKNWKTKERSDPAGRQLFWVGLASPQPMVSCFAFYYCTGEKLRELLSHVETTYEVESHTDALTAPDASADHLQDMLHSTAEFLFEFALQDGVN